MIACDRCSQWYHVDCVAIEDVDVEFICCLCVVQATLDRFVY